MSWLVRQMYGLDTVYVLLQVMYPGHPGKFIFLFEAGSGVLLRMVQAAQGIRVSMFGSLGSSDN